MASLTQLKKYYNHEFDDWGGTTSKDYKGFESKYINYIKRICKDNEWQFISGNRNHYQFSCVIQRNDSIYIYISISDVRYWHNEWYNRILIRTMKHATDWTGNSNNYSNLENLVENISKLR